MTGFAAVEMTPECEMPPLLTSPEAAVEIPPEPGPVAAGMNVAVEVDLPNGARVRIGKDASAAVLSGVFAALGQR